MRIPLTQGAVALIDEEDFELIAAYKWRLHSNGYACTWDKNRKMVLMHRLINNTSVGMDTDHINRNKLDNRRDNLRSVTSAENNRNRACYNKSSGLLGAYRSGKKWRAYIKDNKKQVYLGSFNTPEKANEAYICALWEQRCKLSKPL